jgi:catechol 2,3-dioxygenase-like lactoylglutathione lyase family enzyme
MVKYCGVLLVVSDMERSKTFYKTVLGLNVEVDLGANATLTGGISLQTLETWRQFTDKDNVTFYNNAVELYFEEDHFDTFIATKLDKVNLVHPTKECPWGQRVIRLYDPDGHVIEVGENMRIVTQRFINNGLSIAETATRMGVPESYVKNMTENKTN